MNPLYDYVFEIANRMYPTWDTDINDEQYQTAMADLEKAGEALCQR